MKFNFRSIFSKFTIVSVFVFTFFVFTGSHIVFAAAPTILGAAYKDINNDGTIDRVDVTFSESVEVGSTFEASDWTFPSNPNSLVVSSGTISGTDVRIVVTGAPATTTVLSATTVKYTNQGTTDSIVNGAADVAATSSNISIIDGALPIIISDVVNKSSSRNTFTINYSEPVTLTGGDSNSTGTKADITTAGTVAGFGSFATAGNTTIPTTFNTVSGSGTATIVITIANATAGYINNTSTTGPSGNFTPVSSSTVADASGNQVNTSVVPTTTVTSAWTLTQPTITSVTIADAAGSNGSADRATVVFSASVRDANITNADGLLGGATHTGTFTTGTANDNTTVFNLTSDSLTMDTSPTAAQFTYTASTTKITDLFGNLLNTATDGAIANADITETDGIAPRIVSVSPTDASTQNSRINPITITFSEAMDQTSLTFSTSPTDTYTISWTSSTVASLSHTILGNGQSYTATLSAATDSALNSLYGLPYAWTFTNIANGNPGAGGGASYYTPPVVVVNPGCSGGNTVNSANGNPCINNVGNDNQNSSVKNNFNFGTAKLKRGSKGEGAKELQKFLNQVMKANLVVDGYIGVKSITLVKKWQKENGLVADGIIGDKTKTKMNSMVK